MYVPINTQLGGVNVSWICSVSIVPPTVEADIVHCAVSECWLVILLGEIQYDGFSCVIFLICIQNQ